MIVQRITDTNDFKMIMEIENQAFIEPYTFDLYLHDFTQHPFSEYYKLLIDAKICGYCGIWVIDNTSQITTIAINPSLQRLGYGKKLLDYIIKVLKKRKVTIITLEVRITNKGAIKMYQKFGFYKVAIRKHYYENGEDAFLMKLDL